MKPLKIILIAVIFYTISSVTVSVYSQSPSMSIQLTAPNREALKNVAERIEFNFEITYNGQPISGANATLYKDNRRIGRDTSNSKGILEFKTQLKTSDPVNLKLVVDKKGYSRTTETFTVSNFFKVSYSPNTGDLITFENVAISIGLSVNGEGRRNVEVQLFLNGDLFNESNTNKNGYSIFNIDNPKYGNNFYNAKVHLDGSVIETGNVHFQIFKELLTSLYTIDISNIEDFYNPEITLFTKSFSHNVPVQGAKIDFYVNDQFIGENYSSSDGSCTFTYTLGEKLEFYWFVKSSKQDYLDYQSITRNVNLIEHIPVLYGETIYPRHKAEISNSSSIVELSVQILENEQSSSNSEVTFYVNDAFIGTANTNENGIAKLSYLPPIENKTYRWYYKTSKYNYSQFNSSEFEFYYPKQLPNIVVVDSYVSSNRIGINSTVTIGYQLEWENGHSVNNTSISINGIASITNEYGWVYLPITNNVCEAVTYDSIKIHDVKFSNVIFKHKPTVIWDIIIIKIKPENTRISIGEKFNFTLSAYYKYDYQNFTGTCFINESLVSLETGDKMVKINNIQDDKYSVHSFLSNEAHIIWDKIIFENITPKMYSFMNVSDLAILAYYDFDKTTFNGTYSCIISDKNEESVIVDILDCSDNSYGLSALEIKNNEIEYSIFYVNEDIHIIRPGRNVVVVSLSENLGSNCDVYINDEKLEYDSETDFYSSELSSYGIITMQNMKIIYEGSIIYEEFEYIINYENVAFYILSTLFIFSLSYNIYSIRKYHVNLF
ncbi:MAG: hypothetical protein ACTSQY_06930 [Candidatus Odinarchaeia archaeon]